MSNPVPQIPSPIAPSQTPIRAVVLLSGGLDSQLVIRILQEQNIAVEALNFKTVFTCCQDLAGVTARELGVPLTVIGQEDDYLDVIKKPQFGRGKGANPCVDCRIYMFRRAKAFMEQVGAQFIASGEVVGQRPMSQKRADLDIIAHHSDLDGLLLRPLSARLLPPTIPEKEGWVNRDQLYAIQGRSRKELLELADKYGLKHVPSPSSGCALTEPLFSKKVFDVLRHSPQPTRWDFELLKIGRHFRFGERTKVVVGRNEEDNARLAYVQQLPEATDSALLSPANFVGPTAVVVGADADGAIEFGIGLLLRYSKRENDADLQVRVETRGANELRPAVPLAAAQSAPSIAK